MIAQRLVPGDEIRVIAPSMSMAVVKGKQIELAVERLTKLGFKVTFGKYADIHDEFFSTSIKERITDLHEAFSDNNVKAILAATGGYNANQLLKYIDYSLIARHPKIFCGFGDNTAILLAIYQKTGLVTYSGPHLSSLGMRHDYQYTIDHFLQAVTNDAPLEIEPSDVWSDDPWHLEEDERNFVKNEGYLVLQEGEVSGSLVGGNLSTINLLQGTEFFPTLKNSILFLEDDEEIYAQSFDRKLQSLLHLPDASEMKAVLIGRFHSNSQVTEEALLKMIAAKKELHGIPIIANVNFGHVHPFVTMPVGSMATVKAYSNELEITIEQTE